ncbi:MAG: endolytic transglycosylase MltG [Planctomycetes bacterium]|jgi:UPF0755 protein|nr:endolytic transglycosylase MltG [Planctomycetota bacterium]
MKKSLKSKKHFWRYLVIASLVVIVIIVNVNSYLAKEKKRQQEAAKVVIKKEKTIRLHEGWTTREIGQYFENQGMFQSEELLELVGFPQIDYRQEKKMPTPKDYSKDFSFLDDKPTYYGLEGYLFPDTYSIYEDATLDEVVRKMLKNFDRKLSSKMREDIKKQGKTIYEIVTMASILEKEVPMDTLKNDNKNAKIVSGIFWQRIDNGQPLQSCATLAYVLGINKAQYSYEDTKVASPYNTYLYKGLPIGPIANPSLLALQAAIYPTPNNYNYFLSPTDTKEIVFARTYEEHLRNKAKYLK